MRIEKDTLGEVKVPDDVLWGAQTQRSLTNFQISNRNFPVSFIKSLVEIKRACAIVNGELKQIPNPIALAIIQAADEILDDDFHLDQFPLDIFQTGSGTQTNMNANEVLSNRAIQIMGGQIGSKDPVHPNDHVNKGQSSNDVIPTAMHLSAIVDINDKLLPTIDELMDCLNDKVDEFEHIVKIGRTHLQDAVPLTLGQEFSAFVYQLKIARDHIVNTMKYLEELPIGGTAVGTGLNAHPKLSEMVCDILSKRMDIKFRPAENKFALIAAKDSFASVSASLRSLAIVLLKIANDIRWLASGPRCGLGELILPENEPGSSIMPGKINPTQNEMLIQVVAQVLGNDQAISLGAQWGVLQLNLMKPMIISNLLESIEILSNGIISFKINALENLQVNHTRINQLVEQSLMLATALTPVKEIGYDKAAQIAKQAYKEGKTIKEVLLQENIMSEEKIDEILDLSKMV